MSRKELINFFKRQTIVVYISLFVVVLGTIMVSSAIFSTTKTANKEQVVTTGDFTIAYKGNSTITNKVYIAPDVSTENAAKNSDKYEFTVTNNGTITSSYKIYLKNEKPENSVDMQYVMYSLDGENFKDMCTSLDNCEIGSGTLSTEEKEKTHSLYVLLKPETPDEQISKNLKLTVEVVAEPNDPSGVNGLSIAYSGKEEIIKIPYTGTYTLTAAGAEGGISDSENTVLTGGKGAVISSDFYLEAEDVLHVVVGGQGTTTNSTEINDGTSGSGGGGTFIFKEIPEVTDPSFQFEKDNQAYEVLLVGAGGSGTGDLNNNSALFQLSGLDGNSVDYKSPSNYTSFSIISNNPNENINSNGVLGIKQYINYDLKGTSYTQAQSKCTGGFGGGSCSDDNRSYGGGWSGSDFVAYSWSKGVNTIASSEVTNSGNGYVNIKLK